MTGSRKYADITELDRLRVSRVSERCNVLGPGTRAVVWVQGCPLRCKGCVASETLPFGGGTLYKAKKLGWELAGLPNIEGITFSGGEPTSQAFALNQLITAALERNPELSFMSYTGFTLEQLLKRRDMDQLEFLKRLDILIDGPYVEKLHTDLKWRGSSNQRIVLMSNRYQSSLIDHIDERGTWLEFETSVDSVQWMGIPPKGFREQFENQMESHGVLLKPIKGKH